MPLSFVPLNLIDSTQRLLGFEFTFSPTYTSSDGKVTSAYFCHIYDVAPTLAMQCPACTLLILLRRGLLRFPSRPVFSPNFFSPAALASYLRLFANRLLSNNPNHFKSHPLRIGGHTFYTMKDMSADLRHFLACRVIYRCSL